MVEEAAKSGGGLMLVVVVVDNCEYGGVLEGLEAHGDGLVFREGRCAQQGGGKGRSEQVSETKSGRHRAQV